MHYVGTRDIVSIYREVEFYNHPPVMSVLLITLYRLLGDNSPWFPFILRLPAICSDIITTLLVFGMAKRFFSELLPNVPLAIMDRGMRIAGMWTGTPAILDRCLWIYLASWLTYEVVLEIVNGIRYTTHSYSRTVGKL